MAYNRTRYNYHDGQLQSFTLGPRNELILIVHLDTVWNKNEPEEVVVRFGAIENMTEVAAFFKRIESSSKKGDFWGEVVGVVYEHKNKWIVDLDPYGSIIVKSSKMSER